MKIEGSIRYIILVHVYVNYRQEYRFCAAQCSLQMQFEKKKRDKNTDKHVKDETKS